MKRNLAVSTVVANMLMISITLSLAAILVAWAGTTYGTFSGSSQLFFLQRGQALQERFVIEYVYFIKNPTSMIQIFVRNVGVKEIQVAAIYVNSNSFTGSFMNPQSPCTVDNNAVTMTVGQSSSTSVCQFLVATTWASGSTVSIVVATLRGNQATYWARGP